MRHLRYSQDPVKLLSATKLARRVTGQVRREALSCDCAQQDAALSEAGYCVEVGEAVLAVVARKLCMTQSSAAPVRVRMQSNTRLFRDGTLAGGQLRHT